MGQKLGSSFKDSKRVQWGCNVLYIIFLNVIREGIVVGTDVGEVYVQTRPVICSHRCNLFYVVKRHSILSYVSKSRTRRDFLLEIDQWGSNESQERVDYVLFEEGSE